MIDVFDKQTGETISVNEQDAQEGYLAGRFGFLKGQLNFVDGEGSFNLDSADAAEAFAGGARLATTEEIQAERDKEQFGTGLQRVAADAEAVARGATFGLSDIAESALLDNEEEIRKRRDINPETGALEVAGAVGSLLIPGAGQANLAARGAGAATRGVGLAARLGQGARAATAIPRATAALGRAAEGAVSGRLGGGVLARATGAAAGGTVEGAVVGTAQALSEASLGDIELTAENVLGSAARGAVFGGAGAGLLTGTAAVTGAGLKKAARKVFGDENLEGLATGAIEGIANKAAFKQFSPLKGHVRKAVKAFGKNPSEKIGRVIREDGIDVFGKAPEEIADVVRANRRTAGEAVGESLEQLDGVVGDAVKPKLSGIAKRLRKEVVEPLTKSSFRKGRSLGKRVERELEPFLASTVDDFGKPIEHIGFRELHAIRKELDDIAYPPGRVAAPTDFQAELQKARRILEDELTKAADIASETAGEAISASYKAAKERFAVYRFLDDVAQDGVVRDAANRTIGLTDTIAGAGAGNIGSIVAMASDMAVTGGIATAVLSGVGGALLNRFMRTQGQKLAANVGSRLVRLRSSSQAFQSRADDAVNKFLAVGKRGRDASVISAAGTLSSSEASVAREQRFEQRIKQLEEAVAQESDMTGVEDEAPQVAQAIQANITRARTYLAQAAPTVPRALGTQLAFAAVPRVEQARFLRRARAADDLSTVVSDIEQGTVTPEAVEAAQQVYPKAWERIRKSFETKLTDAVVEKMTPAQRLQASLVTGRPVHFTLQPEFIAAAQAAWQREEGTDTLSPSQRGAPDTAAQEEMPTDRFI